MKLKSKMVLGMFVIILTALSVCCTVIIFVCKNNLLNTTKSYVKAELLKLEDSLLISGSELNSSDDELTLRSILKYSFSRQLKYADSDTEYVLANGEEILYNNSGINPNTILNLKNDTESKLRITRLMDRDYIITGKTLCIRDRYWQIFVIRDISSEYEQIRQLIVVCVSVGFIVLVIAGLSIIAFLRKIMGPLEQMKKGVDAIAEGNYKDRLSIRGKDEIALMSKSFNKMAESIEQHIKIMSETSEARSRLIHALSHEMKTPITAISGYSYALTHAKLNEEQRKEALEFIDLEAVRLGRLSEKLADLVGLSSNKIELAEISLSDLEKNLKMILRDQNVISFQIAEGVIYGDRDLLIMLITNLCDNAKKAGATKIEIKISEEGIWIKDNGKGIPDAETERIFEMFYQGDSSRNQEGFGLGLALCQKIAQIHKTELKVESKEGEGSLFYLYNTLTIS